MTILVKLLIHSFKESIALSSFLNRFFRRLARKIKEYGYAFFVVFVDDIATGVKGSFTVASLDPI